MEHLWETDSFVDENTLTVNVGRLRKKLEASGLADFIITKFGVGYIIEQMRSVCDWFLPMKGIRGVCMNKVMLMGRLTAKPELRYTPQNTAYTRFSVAVNRTFTNSNGQREADFIGVVA